MAPSSSRRCSSPNVDLEDCLRDLFGLRRVEGKGDLDFPIEGAGGSVDALTRTLNGNATLTSADGALDRLQCRAVAAPAGAPSAVGRRRLPQRPNALREAQPRAEIATGVASVEDIRIDGAGRAPRASAARASIPTRDVDLNGTAQLVGRAATPGGFELPFVVQGPWDDPIILPDPQSLIRPLGRGGAAARRRQGQQEHGQMRCAPRSSA